MMQAKHEGAVVDVSKGPRNILKTLVKAASGWQTLAKGFELDVHFVGWLRPRGGGAGGLAPCGPIVGEPFDVKHREPGTPLHATIGSGHFPLRALEQAVETMREGERARVTIHPRVGYGSQGEPSLGVPPDCFLEYEVYVARVYEVTSLAGGGITKKVLQLPLMGETAQSNSEVVVEWEGFVLGPSEEEEGEGEEPPRAFFQRLTTQTLQLDAPGLPKFWRPIACGDGDHVSGGGRERGGMGEGEVAEFVVAPEWAYGDEGCADLGVPGGARLVLRVTLRQIVWVEEMSSKKDGAAVRRIEKRGRGDLTPSKGDECTLTYQISNGRTGVVYLRQEGEEEALLPRTIVLGEMPPSQRHAIRLACGGAHADTVLELLAVRMRRGEVCEARCQPSFIGGCGDEIRVRATLVALVRRFLVPETEHKVEVRLTHEPDDDDGNGGRSPNREATCTVRYVVRSTEEATAEGGIVEDATAAPISFVHRLDKHVLPCIDHAVAYMRPGSRAVVRSPPEYAYGSQEYHPSPSAAEPAAASMSMWGGLSVLVELELVEVVRFKANYMMGVEEKLETQTRRRAQGNECFKEGDYEGAIKRYGEALQYASLASEVCGESGLPYEKQHELRRGIDEASVATHVNLATCHLKRGDPLLAVQACTKALQIDAGSVKALFRRGQAYKETGDYGQARRDLTAAARRGPEVREIRCALEELKGLEAADKTAAKALWHSKLLGGSSSSSSGGSREQPLPALDLAAAPNRFLPDGEDLLGDGRLLKRVLRTGNEAAGRPPLGSNVVLHYRGFLADGTCFDSSRERFGHPFFQIGSGVACRGLEEGVRTMRRGELAELACMSEYAYGAVGWKKEEEDGGESGESGGYKVPPHATVRWEVEVFSWSGLEAATAMGSKNGGSDATVDRLSVGAIVERAYVLKDQGGEYVAKGLWGEAAERYGEAAQLLESPWLNGKAAGGAQEGWQGWQEEVATLLSQVRLNGAQCELKRSGWLAAARLCDQVLEKPALLTQAQRVKALYRRQQARAQREELAEALSDLDEAAKLDPANEEVRRARAKVAQRMRGRDREQRAVFGGMFDHKPGEEAEEEAAAAEEAQEFVAVGAAPGRTAWLDVSVDGEALGRITIELDYEAAPKTCENFRCLCTGEKGLGLISGKPLHYKGVAFHRVLKGFLIQGGDIVYGGGMGGESIYGGQFDDEVLRKGAHARAGVVSMANGGKDMNGSQFFITTTASTGPSSSSFSRDLDESCVAFGRVVGGMEEVVRKIEMLDVDAATDAPCRAVRIQACGAD